MKFATLFLFLLHFSSINVAAEGMVIIHIRDTKLYRDKNDLIRENKYFSDLFSKKFSEIPKDANNDFHVTLERNRESMEVVWDFLIYGKIKK